mgnify:CR=1 FL=1
MKLLTLDIETSPNVAHIWGLFNQNVGLNQLMESTEVIGFAAKWYGQKKVEWYSNHHDGHDVMVGEAYRLLDEADVIVHYNGTSFDIKHLNREFATSGMTPPAPYAQVDLLRVVKARFRFSSNKLQHVSQSFGLAGKRGHEGHTLWVKCMAGDSKAWDDMRKYCIQDVRLTEQLYDCLLPWIPNHPNVNLIDGTDGPSCPNCGGSGFQRRGFQVALSGRYQRLQCQGCGAWSRETTRESSVKVVGTK